MARQVSPESTVAFHELAEAFEKIDGGKGGSYEAGHNAALQRELKLRDQRPYLKGYNTGAWWSRAARSFLRRVPLQNQNGCDPHQSLGLLLLSDQTPEVRSHDLH